jgi:hypothetical protein
MSEGVCVYASCNRAIARVCCASRYLMCVYACAYVYIVFVANFVHALCDS